MLDNVNNPVSPNTNVPQDKHAGMDFAPMDALITETAQVPMSVSKEDALIHAPLEKHADRTACVKPETKQSIALAPRVLQASQQPSKGVSEFLKSALETAAHQVTNVSMGSACSTAT